MSDRDSIASTITDRELAAWKKQFELELMMGRTPSEIARPPPHSNPDASYNPEKMQGLYAFPQERIESMPNRGIMPGNTVTSRDMIMQPSIGWAGTEYERQNEPSFEGQWSGEVPL